MLFVPHQHSKFVQYHVRNSSFTRAPSCFFIETYLTLSLPIFLASKISPTHVFSLFVCIANGAKLGFASVFNLMLSIKSSIFFFENNVSI